MKNRASISDLDRVMLECGMQSLHPGGLKTTDEMLRKCAAGEDKEILVPGCGKGLSAAHIAENYGARVTGLDRSRDMVAEARIRAKREGLQERLHFVHSDALPLPFPDGSFDIVIHECVSTLLDTERFFSEVRRVLKPGGRSGSIDIIWRETPPVKIVRGIRDLWDGFHTYTLKEWKKLFLQSGFTVTAAQDLSLSLPQMESNMLKDLGAPGMMKLSYKIMTDPRLRRAMYDYWRVFRDYEEYFGYAYFVAEKADAPAGEKDEG